MSRSLRPKRTIEYEVDRTWITGRLVTGADEARDWLLDNLDKFDVYTQSEPPTVKLPVGFSPTVLCLNKLFNTTWLSEPAFTDTLCKTRTIASMRYGVYYFPGHGVVWLEWSSLRILSCFYIKESYLFERGIKDIVVSRIRELHYKQIAPFKNELLGLLLN